MSSLYYIIAGYETAVVLWRAWRWCKRNGIPYFRPLRSPGFNMYIALVFERYYRIETLRLHRKLEEANG